MPTVHERLAAWRHRRGLSQRQAAAQAGLHQPTWSDLESGRAKRVSVDVAILVQRITDGEIRVEEWGKVAEASESGEHPAADVPPRSNTA